MQLDKRTKTFCQIFDRVTPGQSAIYGGQSVQPDTEISFDQLPEKPPATLPDVTVPKTNTLKEVTEMEVRVKPTRQPSARYSEAHERYIRIFG